MATLGNTPRVLLFSVEENCIYLHINDTVIIPFRDLDEWNDFANQMLAMAPEIKDNL